MKTSISIFILLLISYISTAQQLIKTIPNLHTGKPVSVAISADGKFALTSGTDQKTKMIDIDAGRVLRSYLGTNMIIKTASFNNDASLFMTEGPKEGKFVIWKSVDNKAKSYLDASNNQVNSIAFNPVSNNIAAGTATGKVILWNSDYGSVQNSIDAHKTEITSVAYNSDGTLLASTSSDGSLKIWKVLGGRFDTEINTKLKNITSICFSANGKFLIAGGRSNIKIWNTTDWSEFGEFKDYNTQISSIALSPDDQYLAASSSDNNNINIWKLETKQIVKSFEAHIGGINDIAFASEKALLVSVGNDNSLNVWNVDELNIALKQTVAANVNPSNVNTIVNNENKSFQPVTGDQRITWLNPSQNNQTTSESSYRIEACINLPNKPDVLKITVNGVVQVDKSDAKVEFRSNCSNMLSEVVKLQNGNNQIKVEIKAGTETINSEITLTYSDFAGKYYALLLAVNDYTDPAISDLDQPLADAQRLYDVLTTNYSFDKANVRMVKNPTREQLIDELDALAAKTTKDDNVLIFYAGHGWWDQNEQTGYWFPVDAKKTSKANWFSNSQLYDKFRAINAKHTLLIADACFGGAVFKTRDPFADATKAVKMLYDMPSRKAMTSGTMNVVPDKSVFLEYLVKRLSNNTEKYLPARTLFSSIEQAVRNNTDNVPQYGTIEKTGDEGGDFIFIRK